VGEVPARADDRVPASRQVPVVRGRPRDPAVDAAIRAATLGLLAEAGYARLTMDQVAARARVSKSSLYLRWPNKVALVADALQHRARVVPEVPDTGSLPGDMRVFLSGLLRPRSEAARALAAVSGEIATNPELRQAWHRGLAGMLTGCLRVIVGRAVARGSCPLTVMWSCCPSCRCRCCRTGGWNTAPSPMTRWWTGLSASSTALARRADVPGTGDQVGDGRRGRRVIEVRALTKRYGQVPAVDGLSFDVLHGHVLGRKQLMLVLTCIGSSSPNQPSQARTNRYPTLPGRRPRRADPADLRPPTGDRQRCTDRGGGGSGASYHRLARHVS
jgi:AcrR family transcriptional regulator